MEVREMKIFLLTIALAALTGGLAQADRYNYSSCANSNSRACQDDRAAFARHHNGQTPNQWNNHWYQGQRGRWSQQNNSWRWNGVRGDQYSRGRDGWQWSGARAKHDRDRE